MTQQDLDERLSAYNQAQANLAAADANVARLRNLQGFNQVVAPFDGVVTRRNIDVGDLVNAGNGGYGTGAVFRGTGGSVAAVCVCAAGLCATQVKVGDTVTVLWRSARASNIKGSVARTARAIDTATRTMQVEIRVPNPNDALISGSYVQVTLPDQQSTPSAGGSHQCPAVSARRHTHRPGRR